MVSKRADARKIATIIVPVTLGLGQFWRIRPLAGWLMVPYLAWLILAASLNAAIEALNPGAGRSLLGF